MAKHKTTRNAGATLSKEIRDPVHGLIPLSSMELEVINTSAFQRLRGIRQLAFAHLGFPGANHTRFEHCIGVMHVAWKICVHLRNRAGIELTDRDLQDIRLAALLHDIGHGPFSHVSEYLLVEFLPQGTKTEEIHEEISRRIIVEDSALSEIIGNSCAKRIAGLLRVDTGGDVAHDIVSGLLDADKMDYLLRDSYYAGVKYGVFDLDRLINVLTVIDSGIPRLAVSREGIETVEQYVLAKYFITQQVYQHKIRRITDKMIVEGIRQAILAGDQELGSVYRYSRDKAYVRGYLCYDDRAVIDHILRTAAKNSLAYNYIDRLRQRNLLKELYNERLTTLLRDVKVDPARLEALKSGQVAELRDNVAKILKCDPDYTFVAVYSIKDPLTRKADPFFDDEGIWVKKPNGEPSTLSLQSVLFKSIVEDARVYRVSILSQKSNKAQYGLKQIERIENVLKKYLSGL